MKFYYLYFVTWRKDVKVVPGLTDIANCSSIQVRGLLTLMAALLEEKPQINRVTILFTMVKWHWYCFWSGGWSSVKSLHCSARLIHQQSETPTFDMIVSEIVCASQLVISDWVEIFFFRDPWQDLYYVYISQSLSREVQIEICDGYCAKLTNNGVVSQNLTFIDLDAFFLQNQALD